MGGRRYVNIRISVGESPLEDILARLPAETSRDIYRLTLTGERENALNLSVLKEALEPRFYSLSLVDATEPKRNLWAKAGENTLHGQFLQRMQQRISESDDPQQRARWMMAVRAGLAALDGREEPF